MLHIQEELMKCLPHLRAYARFLTHNVHDADDLVQDAVVRILGAAERFTPGTNFKAWSFTILRNRFLNAYTKAGQNRSLDDIDPDLFAQAPTQEIRLEFQDFQHAFARLPMEYRDVLALVVGGDMNYEEVAKICGCAVGTVKSRVFRARAQLKAMLGDEPVAARIPARAARERSAPMHLS